MSMKNKRSLLTLQSQIQPGRIDVNIMTKVDKNNHDKSGNYSQNRLML